MKLTRPEVVLHQLEQPELHVIIYIDRSSLIEIMSSNIRVQIATVTSWILSITAIALLTYWTVHFSDGYKFGIWHHDRRIFNYHPLCMMIGLIFFAPTGLYRNS